MRYFDKSPMIITALLPYIGYEKATELIEEFYSGDEKNMRSFLEKKLGREFIEKTFSPYRITSLGYSNYGKDTDRK